MTTTPGAFSPVSSPPTSAVTNGERPGGHDHDEYVPARATGVELLGEFEGSGYREGRALARRADGQTIQLTTVLYEVLAAIDGRRSYRDIAGAVSERIGKEATPEDVRLLAESKLRPLGVLRHRDGSEPAVKKTNPLLALKNVAVVSNPTVTRRLTAPFAVLFLPPVVLAIVTGFVASSAWLLFEHGLASATREALFNPGLLLLVFALTILSAAFHEFGHAAACRYGGASPGAMGVALYLVWPAFYTDVTDSYRLDRRGRLRVDLGGLYFNCVFALATFGAWAVTGWDALLLAIFVQLLQMLRQLLPFVRLDGYHILADITGVPDLFSRIKPTLRSLVPGRWGSPEAKLLKPWARAAVTAWVIVVVPVLLVGLVVMVVVLPRVAATAWESLGHQRELLGDAWGDADASGIALRFVSIVALVVPLLGTCYIVVRVARRITFRVWRSTADQPAARALITVLVLGLIVLLIWAWWPQGQYRPIQRQDGGTLPGAIGSVTGDPVGGRAASRGGPNGVGPTIPAGRATSGESPPAAAAKGAVQWRAAISSAAGSVPVDVDRVVGRAVADAPDVPGARPWVVKLVLDGSGKNQVSAINTEDGSSVLVIGISFIVDADGTVDPINQAYARSSCVGCQTVVIAFQVVLVTSDADVIIPVNTAEAVNVDCVACVTYALARQLVIDLTGSDVVTDLSRVADTGGAAPAPPEDAPSSGPAPATDAPVEPTTPATSSEAPTPPASSEPEPEPATTTTTTTTVPAATP